MDKYTFHEQVVNLKKFIEDTEMASPERKLIISGMVSSLEVRYELDMAEGRDEMAEREKDLVEVVRCKDCKDWYPFSDKKFGYCRREFWDDDGHYRLKVETNHDDYCSYGERQDG